MGCGHLRPVLKCHLTQSKPRAGDTWRWHLRLGHQLRAFVCLMKKHFQLAVSAPPTPHRHCLSHFPEVTEMPRKWVKSYCPEKRGRVDP